MMIEAETPVTDSSSKMYLNIQSPPFNIEIFEDVGRALCIGILDLIEKNSISRIPLSVYRTLAVRQFNL